MTTTSRIHFLAAIVFAVVAIGCDPATPFDGERPVIVGTITSRDPMDEIPAIMWVWEDGATSDDCYPHRAPFTLGPDVMVFRNGSRKEISELKVGRRVSVFAPYVVTKGCYAVEPAQGVFLE